MDERTLSKEEQVNAVKKVINKLKITVVEEQQARQEVQEKLFAEKQQKIRAEQKLTEKEFALNRKCEEIEHLQFKIESLQKKNDDLEHLIKDKGRGSGFFGKMFIGKEIEQQKLQVKELEEELEIKTQEIERLHMQIFEMKRENNLNEEQFEKERAILDLENGNLKLYIDKYQIECKDLSRKLLESENNLRERQNKIDELLRLIQKEEEQIRNFREKIILQNTSLSGLDKTLRQNQEHLMRFQDEGNYYQETMQFMRDSLRNLICKLELHEEQRYQIEVQDVLKEVKSLYDNKFTCDLEKEQRKILIKTEQLISQEVLQGQLRTSLRLERQNGKIIQMNSILLLRYMRDQRRKYLNWERLYYNNCYKFQKNQALEKKNRILQDKVSVLEQKKNNTSQGN